MNPLAILVDIIPAGPRKYVYAAYALAVLVVAVCAIIGVSTGAADQVLTYLGGLLGVLATANTGVAPKP